MGNREEDLLFLAKGQKKYKQTARIISMLRHRRFYI